MPESISQDTQSLLDFIDRSPSPFHAVESAIKKLSEASFVSLREEEGWPSSLPEKFYVTRNDSTLAAFVMPKKVTIEKGFLLIGAHTDSPCLRLRDKGDFSKHGYRQWGIEVYGGAIHHTWTDIDLGVAGRLVLKRGGQRETVLVASAQPLLRVPNLAIHLDRGANDKKTFNPQTELIPIAGLETSAVSLLDHLCQEADVDSRDVLTTELSLYNFQNSSVWGLQNEFIAAARLDNLAMCEAGLTGLTRSLQNDPGQIRALFLFDHEECGSQSAQGAHSNFMEATLTRIAECCGATRSDALQGMSHSYFISADMAHAVHPNYEIKHDRLFMPRINQGPVIKSNTNMRYATDARSAAAFLDLCAAVGVNCQSFINRSDLGCGSTIGPMTAARMGCRTVDVGTPQLAMHSAREMGGSEDPALINKVFAHFYSHGVGQV